MHTFRHLDIDIRSQAYLLFGLTALWWFSLICEISVFGFQSISWWAVAILAPLMLGILSVFLFISYRRANRAHKLLVRVALAAAATPLLAIGIFIFCLSFLT